MKRKELARIRIPLRMADAVDAVYASLPKVECQGKCSDCCSPVGNLMTTFEYDRITKRVGFRPNTFVPTALTRHHCNLLTADGRCSVYDIRPGICRVWGSDRKIPCPFGCAGANSLPADGGRPYLNRLRVLTEDYQSG